MSKLTFELPLVDATAQGRLDEFAELADARLRDLGFQSPSRPAVEAGLAKNVKPHRSEDRTSRSSSDDGSTGT
ncbi:MAG: hypothetical protein KKE02_23810 [Alphaproteobacteria bacterium]|nr:hypothetical protein [Alphaproteobacteria bacterium]MBU1514921.1 hypothetical protein [Alphaproteobacteria bacterium]MBU2094963.1 hypothetical protein [Alphaproteobacteria bacterium]MBU2154064.1 hypothetical protein [Alphaproteobacteria bacterium]MBU2305423.1 hypothetical protein [Alphaproteobacteria bacterium]